MMHTRRPSLRHNKIVEVSSVAWRQTASAQWPSCFLTAPVLSLCHVPADALPSAPTPPPLTLDQLTPARHTAPALSVLLCDGLGLLARADTITAPCAFVRVWKHK